MTQPDDTLLITGGCGYLGSQLIRDLAADPRFHGQPIRILDNLNRGDQKALMDLPSGCRYEFIEGDILDRSTLRAAFEGVTAVIHLAAIVRTPLGFEDPAWVTQVNHWGTASVVETCVDAGVGRFVFASSAAVYGPGGPFDESARCRPIGPYGQSKLRAEQCVLAAADRGLEPIILRLGTIYGIAASMRFDAFVNRFAYLAGIGRSLTIYGSGEQRRAVVHVKDASAAVRDAAAGHLGPKGRCLNVASANPSVLEVVDAVRKACPEVGVQFTEQDVLTHFSLEIDAAAARAAGWSPGTNLTTGLVEEIGRFRGLESPYPSASDLDTL